MVTDYLIAYQYLLICLLKIIWIIFLSFLTGKILPSSDVATHSLIGMSCVTASCCALPGLDIISLQIVNIKKNFCELCYIESENADSDLFW